MRFAPGVREEAAVGRYLDMARTAAPIAFCPDRSYEINELNEKSPLETHGQILRAVLLVVPDGVPEEWAQGVGDLMVMPAPPAWSDEGWKTLQEDALRFLKEWAGQAQRMGWEALDLFGAHTPYRTHRAVRLHGARGASEGPPRARPHRA